jgi:hypothetical protein
MQSRRRKAGLVVSISLVALVFLDCSDSPLPGSLLGTYRVQTTAQTNTCGPGQSAPSPWIFDVQLSEQGTTLYWSWMDGSPFLSNTLDAQRQTSLTATETGNVDGTADGGLGPCTMVRNDSVQLTLDAGTPPSAFQGTIGYVFSVYSGSNCTDQLASSGGTYDVLPCSMSFTIAGMRQ